jgi:hypothetical protein
MDHYLVDSRLVLAEEFVRRGDFSTEGLRSSDASLSRLIRARSDLSAVAIEGPTDRPPLRDHERFRSGPMLELTPHEPLPGFREKRLYSVLFARRPDGDPAEAGELVAGGDRYSWRLRRVANGVAWCLDVTAHLDEGDTLGPVLDRLTGEMRMRHGLIPVTTERFH